MPFGEAYSGKTLNKLFSEVEELSRRLHRAVTIPGMNVPCMSAFSVTAK